MQQERHLSSTIFRSWSYCTNIAKLDIRIFEIKCYSHDLIGQFVSFMVCSKRSQEYRILTVLLTFPVLICHFAQQIFLRMISSKKRELCTPACGQCSGMSCENSEHPDIEDCP